MSHKDGVVWTGSLSGQEIRFFIADKDDVIQRHHFAGAFYELDELAIISEYFPAGGVFVDIGSNVGNHLIYVCKYLHPSQAIVFEPNPPAASVLTLNIVLNGLQRIVDSSYISYGLSDNDGRAEAVTPNGNLGATRMLATMDGGLKLIRGDDALSNRRVDFIKIDVEGMEIQALTGLCETISRWRPSIFIEVDNFNNEAFQQWLAAKHYVIVRTYKRYPQNENYMILPAEVVTDDIRLARNNSIIPSTRNDTKATAPVKKNACAFTMVYNESVYLPIWLEYYGKQLGFENLIVLDHGSNDGSTETLRGARVENIERGMFDEVERAKLISNFQRNLLEEYDCVIFSDVDELLVADPELFDGLLDFISQRCDTFVNAVGLDVIHNVFYENRINLEAPILSQRKYVQFSSKYCKPLVSKIPLKWFAGFHDCDYNPNVDKNLYMFHLKKFDYLFAIERLTKFREINWSELAIREGHGIEYRLVDEDFEKKVFPFKDVDLSNVSLDNFDFSEEIKIFQTEKKWFDGPIAKIPDRFKLIF